MNKFVLCDDDTMQYIRKLENRCYEIICSVQFPDENGFVCRRIIDLNDYEMDDDFCQAYLRPFDYEDAVNVSEIYGAHADQIIAECIAETEIWERYNIVFRGPFQDCLSYIRSVVKSED